MDTGPSLYPSMVQGLKRFFSSSWLNCSLVGVAPPWEWLSHIFAILRCLETSHRFCLIQGEEVIHNTGTGAESGSHANSVCLICYLCSPHCVFSTRTRALAWFLCSWLRRLQSSNHKLYEEVPAVFSSKTVSFKSSVEEFLFRTWIQCAHDQKEKTGWSEWMWALNILPWPLSWKGMTGEKATS